MADYAEPVCQGLAGGVLDELVAEQVLTALKPAALELDLVAGDDLERERRGCIRIGGRNSSGLATRWSGPFGSTTRSSRRIAWWRGSWSGVGRRR